MQAPRAVAGLSLDCSKTPFIGGGRASTSVYNKQTNFFTYGTWQTLTRFTVPRYFPGLSKITFTNGTTTQVVTGGTTNGPPNGTFYSTNTIDVLTSSGWIQYAPSVPVTIYSHGQVTLDQSNIMLIGGIQNEINYQPNTYVHNFDTATWSQGPPLQTGRNGHRCCRMPVSSTNNTMGTICVGGINSGSPALTSSEILIDGASLWYYGPVFPRPITASQAVDSPSGGCCMVGGYPNSNGVYNSITCLQYLSSAWIDLPQTLQTPRYAHVAITVPSSTFNCA